MANVMSALPPTALLILMAISLAIPSASTAQSTRRPPATPLIAIDPYFSIWSTSDTLNGGTTRHWTGREHPLGSLIRVDGKTFRLMGANPASVEALPQTSLQVFPTRTIYSFKNASVEVKLTFTTPTLPDDLDILSRPASYLTWDVASVDGKEHDVAVYLEAGSELAVNTTAQEVVWAKEAAGNLNLLKVGRKDQEVLAASGDDLRIEWGHLYLAVPKTASSAIGSRSVLANAFTSTGLLPQTIDSRMPRAVSDQTPVVATSISFGKVGQKSVSRHAILAYDDDYSIQYFGKNLRPYWKRKGMTATAMLTAAEKDYSKLSDRCEAFDEEVVADMTRAGGEDYAYLGSLAYRQSFAAQKVAADSNGQPLMFSKENFSNGCIATVDVLYPAAPALLLFSPALTKASLVPVLEYAASSRWKWPFAPHDLGTYPLANGQVYGGGERTEENQMPVEESGNMLILLAALAKYEGNADFSAKYWPQLSKWAKYLADKGFDPESQLSTDDFAGHLAHNVNLSVKAIVALRSYAYLCELRGLKAESDQYTALAKGFVDRWIREAADGDHYRLAFDKAGTWSQKYNLVWDRLLGLNLFPKEVARKEMDFYKKSLNKYGLPLDSRRDYTKLDWIVWTATLTGDRADFDALVGPIVDFLDATPDRVPMTDWFRTVEAKKEGFQARSVVGGVFIKLLEDQAVWRKYADRNKLKVGNWAALPKPPVITEVVPTAMTQSIVWSYTTEKPADGWFKAGFNSSNWKSGQAGFGTQGTPGAVVHTKWDTSDIWIRRDFDLPAGSLKDLKLFIHHDEDAEVYINGVLAARFTGFVGKYLPKDLTPAGRAALKPGRNSIAIHCRQTGGGQYIDAGFARVSEQP
jgi:hypothetical protein